MAQRRRSTGGLANAQIAELLAMKAEDAKWPLSKTLRRARTELAGVGPSLEKMIRRTAMRSAWAAVMLLLIGCAGTEAAPVRVRHKEGLLRGFLVLRNLQGEVLADGDLSQTASNDRVKIHLVFKFKDGSVSDETTAFSQRGTFRLISDHLVQKGPAFERPIDMTVNGRSGDVKVVTTEDGKEKTYTEHLKLPPDTANGLLLTLMKDLDPAGAEVKVGYVAATPKPKLVTLAVKAEGSEPFSTGSLKRSATNYVVKVDLSGITGALASLLGKVPPDIHVWILEGEAPAFVKYEGPLVPGGPAWRIELTSPTWPH